MLTWSHNALPVLVELLMMTASLIMFDSVIILQCMDRKYETISAGHVLKVCKRNIH